MSADSDRIGTVIIGAGVLGCAIASRLARAGQIPWVLEQGPRIAEGVTSRNSGVIHAGLYYPPGSLKSQSCIRGQALLYEWCQTRKVAHRNCGKLIVAAESEVSDLEALFQNATASGADGLSWWNQAQLEADAPEVQAVRALFSKNTGVVDPYEFSQSLRLDAESLGAEFLFHTQVLGITVTSAGTELETTRGPILAERVINCAGLQSDVLAKLAGLSAYTIYPWRGHYFRIQNYAFKPERLIYPVKKKNAAGLGVHLTLDLAGGLRLGPDVESIDSKEDFSAPTPMIERRDAFFASASKYLRGLSPEQLVYDSCGIRPKLRSPRDSADPDFVIEKQDNGWIHLLGIESPGLTAALDLADRVVTIF